MISDDAGVECRNSVNFQHISEERDQLIAALGKLPNLSQEVRLIRKQFRIVRAHHAGARSGRRHDIIESGEGLYHLPRNDFGVGFVAGVVGRLTATRLRGGHLDQAAGVFQQLHGRKADGWTIEIDETGDEEADAKR